MQQLTLCFNTQPKSIIDISQALEDVVAKQSLTTGLCHCFLQHTSCSLIVSENSDGDVLTDIETFFSKLVPESGHYRHSLEGPDDMPAHIRQALTLTSLTIPIQGGRLALGTWQAVYLYEHRAHAHQRKLIVSIV